MKRLLYILYIMLLTACNEHEWQEPGSTPAGTAIQVGGLATSALEVSVSEHATRATHVQDAEEVPWLVGPLKQGLDITYGKVSDVQANRNERVAILKLQPDPSDPTAEAKYQKDPVTGWAVYTFKYKSNNEDAIWYGNGEHYFEGMFVPDNLRYGSAVSGTGRTELSSVNTTSAPDITTDQSNATNYSYLEHYLAMPANTKIHATVGRIKLPFYHRLSRVIAYILIDPAMQLDPAHPDVTLKGYAKDAQGNDDPTTTSIRFCNVEVLTGVKDELPSGALTHELTPQWASIRKVIPHFEAEEGSMVQNATGAFEEKDADFYMFYDDKTQEYFFPTMEKWTDYYNSYKSATDQQLETAKVTRTNYGKVPVYDLIVRPTYDNENKVMYDEHDADDHPLTSDQKKALVSKKNKIDFELTLSNGLIYTKEFEFDLNANEQTVVYLRISRESVDYNASGSEIWNNVQKDDDWYGVDNTGGHSLSKAGSSWQRAYTYNSEVSDDKVTDGGFYNETTTGEDGTVGQYVTLPTWKKKFAQAYEGGECHGDYFILTSDITISAKELPDNFVFTGHLDARGNTITITETGQNWTEYVATTEYGIIPLYSDQNGTVYNLPTLYTKTHHDAVYYQQSELTDVNGTTYVTSTLTWHDPVKYTQSEIDAAQAIVNASDYVHGSNTDAEAIAEKTMDDVKTPGYWDTTGATAATTSTVKTAAYDTYAVATGLTVNTMMTSGVTYYEETATDTYTEYSKPTALYKKVDHVSGSALFAGLNGAYNTTTEGEANVHTERGVKVPYKDDETGTGWRAEVMNLKVNGLLFPATVYTLVTDAEGNTSRSRTGYDTTVSPRPVSGNVDNCYDGTGTTKVPNHTPALFKY